MAVGAGTTPPHGAFPDKIVSLGRQRVALTWPGPAEGVAVGWTDVLEAREAGGGTNRAAVACEGRRAGAT